MARRLRPASTPISVEGFIGLPGSGKTYALSVRGLKALDQGRRVFSNYGLRGTIALDVWDHANIGNTKDPGPACDCGSCFVSISDAVVLVDEINLWAPSRMWNALPIGLLHRWAQVRKYQTQILWSAQHEDRVDKVIREVTGWIWECRMVFGARALFWVPGFPTFALNAYEPSDLRRELSRKSLGSQRLRLRADIAESYDTFRIVDMGSHTKRLVPIEAVGSLNGSGRAAKGTELVDRHDTRRDGVLGAKRPGGSGLVGVHDFDGSGDLGDGPPADPWGIPSAASSDRWDGMG